MFIKRIHLFINLKSLIVTLSALGATYLCRKFQLAAEFPLVLIATGIIFPVVFSINSAYKRREAALDEYGNMKAHGRALFFAVRDWLEESRPELQEEARQTLGNILKACHNLFTQPISQMDTNEKGVYQAFSELSLFVKKGLRGNGLASGEVSRSNQYVSKMMISFENIKHIYQYRTPRSLRAFSNFFILILPAVYGPYFAYISKGQEGLLPFVMPVLFSLILMGLDNIQSHLENPFDQIGEDDVVINAEKFMSLL